MLFNKGIYAFNKPKGISSYDLIRRIKPLAEDKKIGHGGTLDPLASGVLVIAIGREYTRNLEKVVKGEKEYLATIELGSISETFDSEGPLKKISDKKITKSEIENALKQFVGHIDQNPPIYSALKINGRPAYKMARAGESVELKSRTVRIKKIEIVSYKYPKLVLRVTCGPGVYIRSLAHDLGQVLEVGGYLTDLVRTRIGDFKIEKAIKMDF